MTNKKISEIIIKHRPWVNKLSYTDEVVFCSCGKKMKSNGDLSWWEWAKHIEQVKNK